MISEREKMNMLTVIFMVFIAGAFFLFLRAEMCKAKGRKLAEKKPVFSKKKLEEFSEDRQVYYSKRLAEMISCQTVSKKCEFHPEEFYKLRSVISDLFPEVTKKAEVLYFGEDCYLYKFIGRNPEKM